MAEKHPRSPGANSDQEQDTYTRRQMKRQRDPNATQSENELVEHAYTPGAPGAAGSGDVRMAAGRTPDDRSGPSPYDVAEPGTPDDHVITKGKPEKPGPTEEERASRGKPGPDVHESEDDTGDLGGDEHSRRLREVEATRNRSRE